jgi:replicative DNA helicase
MQTDTLKFERPFRLKIISLLLDNMWLAKYGLGIIKPEYFEQQDEENTVKAILKHRAAYGYSPVDMDDLMAMAGVECAPIIQQAFELAMAGDNEVAGDVLLKFAKEQAVKLAILEGVDDIAKGNLELPIARMREALKVGDNLLSPGLDPVMDTDKWLYDYGTDKVKTGLYHLDTLLEGGLSTPELGIVLGPPNRGKSMVLINIGFGAAGLGSGKNVVHFTHEMKAEQVSRRYAARMVFKFPSPGDNLTEYDNQIQLAARKLVPGKIRVVGGARKMTTSEWETIMDRIVAEGFKPGLIIDDYFDLLEPPKHYNERRFELSSIYEWGRGMSDKYNCPVWSASQGNRESLSKEIIGMAQIAEDINKAAIADIIVALCQTYEEEQTDQCRLFLAKARDTSKKNGLIACKFYGASQAIITVDYVDMKKKENEQADV